MISRYSQAKSQNVKYEENPWESITVESITRQTETKPAEIRPNVSSQSIAKAPNKSGNPNPRIHKNSRHEKRTEKKKNHFHIAIILIKSHFVTLIVPFSKSQ